MFYNLIAKVDRVQRRNDSPIDENIHKKIEVLVFFLQLAFIIFTTYFCNLHSLLLYFSKNFFLNFFSPLKPTMVSRGLKAEQKVHVHRAPTFSDPHILGPLKL